MLLPKQHLQQQCTLHLECLGVARAVLLAGGGDAFFLPSQSADLAQARQEYLQKRKESATDSFYSHLDVVLVVHLCLEINFLQMLPLAANM